MKANDPTTRHEEGAQPKVIHMDLYQTILRPGFLTNTETLAYLRRRASLAPFLPPPATCRRSASEGEPPRE